MKEGFEKNGDKKLYNFNNCIDDTDIIVLE